jgi:hypothetical protein
MKVPMTGQIGDLAIAENWHLFSLIPGTKRPAVRDWEQEASVPWRARPRKPGPTCDGPRGTGLLCDCPRKPGAYCDADWSGMTAELFWPRRDSGIACGPTGWVVIDLDTSLDGGPDGVASLIATADKNGEEIPLTRTHRTRSGGWQLVYQAIPGREIRNSAGRIGQHVDVRGVGGYIVAPGSYVGPDHKRGGWYVIADDRLPVPLPGWLADLADPPKADRSTRSAGQAQACGGYTGRGSARARLTGLLATVLDAEEGTRNSKLHWASCRAVEMTARGLVDPEAVRELLEEAGLRAGLGEKEVRRTVASAFRDGGR